MRLILKKSVIETVYSTKSVTTITIIITDNLLPNAIG